ncbi:hypothetical protein acdb102_24180 [Acidothermaceae bacterium B102]|nr:hypothetical protein acdb102_24180 [Acidothermaceae bacterium B102]
MCTLLSAPGTVVQSGKGAWTAMPAGEPEGPVDVQSVAALDNGAVLASAIDGVWLSRDGGRSWRRTFTFAARPSYEQANVVRWLYRAGTGFVLDLNDETDQAGQSELAFTDNGTDWRAVVPDVTDVHDSWGKHRIGMPLAFDGTGTHADGLRFDVTTHSGSPVGPMEHTSDGGATWAAVPDKLASLDPVFVPGTRTAFAAPFSWQAPADACAVLDRSDDGGATWRPAAIPCLRDGLGTIDFSDSRHGRIIAGAALLLTSDGGTSWTRTPLRGLAAPSQTAGPEETFATTEIGFAMSTTEFVSSCNLTYDPCTGELLRTTDSGRSWHDTGLQVGPLSANGSTVIAGAGWSQDLGGGVEVSADAGATWTRYLAAGDVRIRQLSRVGGQLTAVTTAGGEQSSDGGRSWTPVPQPAAQRTGSVFYARAGPIVLSADWPGHLIRSTDGGSTWHHVSTPMSAGVDLLGGSAVAFNASDPRRAVLIAANPNEGSDVLVSDDAGATWTKVRSLRTLTTGPIGYDGDTMAFADQGIEVSTDDGKTWAERQVGPQMNAAGVAGTSVWAIAVPGGFGGQPWQGVLVAVSNDQGHTWTTHTLSGLPTGGYAAAASIVPLSADEAVFSTDDATLWRTTDGGATWRQEHPARSTS